MARSLKRWPCGCAACWFQFWGFTQYSSSAFIQLKLTDANLLEMKHRTDILISHGTLKKTWIHVLKLVYISSQLGNKNVIYDWNNPIFYWISAHYNQRLLISVYRFTDILCWQISLLSFKSRLTCIILHQSITCGLPRSRLYIGYFIDI